MVDRDDHPENATAELVRPARKHALVRRFRLTVLEGPDAGLTFPSSGERVVIGTHESAGFILHDQTVSRFHCDIASAEGKAVVRDLGSRNGTIVDAVSVIEAHLRSGAVITLGRTTVRFEMGEDHVSIPLSERDRFGQMVGRSVAMRAAFNLLERAAASDVTVLLEGETGTGKEAAAEGIHLEGSRRDGPFIVVDCGAIPPDLLESELFGHEKGSFTGAVNARQGAFEAAHGGTIFLDEIGELTADLQPKLLRALERKQVKRVGSNHYMPVDVRVVAATNRNLRSEVNARKFRSDLYFRLAVLEVRLPPLREHPDDLPVLVESILSHLKATGTEAMALLRDDTIAEMARHPWTGNVRELRNYVERCLALRERTPLQSSAAEHVAAPGGGFIVDPHQSLREAREGFERLYLEAIMREHEGNVSAAARAAGVDRIHFYRLLWRHGLR